MKNKLHENFHRSLRERKVERGVWEKGTEALDRKTIGT